MQELNYAYLKFLRETHPTLKIFRADSFPLILGFLYSAFKQNNRITLDSESLGIELSDYLYILRQSEGSGIYPEQAKNYLERWTNDGFLRKYYRKEGDDALFELTPAAEKALDWIQDLEKREFVGTESRLLRIYNILKDINYGTSQDIDERIRNLEKQKEELEEEIEALKNGQAPVMDKTRVKENFVEARDLARKLLADFRQVEYNFRELNANLKEKQISALSKGKLLEEVFQVQDTIWDSDQGKSFRAFWEFLMSSKRQKEFENLVENVYSLKEVQETRPDDLLQKIKVYLVEAGDKVNRMNHELVEQVRKFLDEKSLQENKRILSLVTEIKKKALELKDNPPSKKSFFSIEHTLLNHNVMDRPLWEPKDDLELSNTEFKEGETELNTEALFTQLYVDPGVLKDRIRQTMKQKSQVSLKEVLQHFPVEKGLTEVISYIALAHKDLKAVVHEDKQELFVIHNKETDKYFQIKLPEVIYQK
ncbi:MAG: DUF3375 domain-containing protein [Leptospiraceae bacterium]|nr:DUF3375 domain-containing protein [Leptospiraceae bacterium]MCP5502349.1 DUF3375 domain-containing protein [Leptospiraceae bacterium]